MYVFSARICPCVLDTDDVQEKVDHDGKREQENE